MIVGLGLNTEETFLRWLLLQREKYLRLYNNEQHTGWYVMTKQENKNTLEGKKFFLDHVGFKLVELDSYDEIYEGIFE